MSDKRYNGWVNHATWLCNLWLGEDQWMTDELEHMARIRCRRSEMISFLEENFCLERSGVQENGFFADLMSKALHEVDFGEIVDHYIEENSPEEEI